MDKLDKRRIFNVIKSLFTGFDVPLALIVFLLLGTGLVALYSAAIDMPGRVEDQVRNILLSFVLPHTGAAKGLDVLLGDQVALAMDCAASSFFNKTVNGYDIEMAPASNMVFIAYEDRPGVIGTVGTILGEADVNIATMDVGRPSKGGTALMGLTLDSPVEPAVLARIVGAVGAEGARAITLED